jgi:hypothetical protein
MWGHKLPRVAASVVRIGSIMTYATHRIGAILLFIVIAWAVLSALVLYLQHA